jgi:hypothetical protein
LNSYEVSRGYPNIFRGVWDTDKDGTLTLKNFIVPPFFMRMLIGDGSISVKDWNAGYTRMFRAWTGNHFSSFDLDKNNFLNRE